MKRSILKIKAFFSAIPLLTLLFHGLFGCSGGNEKKKEVDAAKIYDDRCASCHGSDGKKGLSGAAELTRSDLSREERIEVIEKGKGAMVPYEGVLSEKEIEALARYLKNFKKSE